MILTPVPLTGGFEHHHPGVDDLRVSTFIIGALLIACGLMTWFGAAAASSPAWLASSGHRRAADVNFGGFVLGTLLALVGGALAVLDRFLQGGARRAEARSSRRRIGRHRGPGTTSAASNSTAVAVVAAVTRPDGRGPDCTAGAPPAQAQRCRSSGAAGRPQGRGGEDPSSNGLRPRCRSPSSGSTKGAWLPSWEAQTYGDPGVRAGPHSPSAHRGLQEFR